MEWTTLNNDVKLPMLGLGVYKVEDGTVTVDTVKAALDAGYRLIDTAAIYQNEESVGQAIRESSVPREDIFVTTKLWNEFHGYDEALQAFQDSLDRLGLDYVDLFLIHWPMPRFGKFVETYKALEQLYEEGKVRAIGVSNFEIQHLEQIIQSCAIVPAVNQVEIHPYLSQKELIAYCKRYDIQIQAWSPLMKGREALEDATIVDIASKYGKSPAQVILRWHLQNGVAVIPKSVTPSRIRENIQVFDFTLTKEDMAAIDGLNRNERTGSDPVEMHKIHY
ncbi:MULTISPECIES: aldo/keto reductase [unclassified Exiguobacterium]|uniref:aldo/keto reductase n=1 Tax=unclassified Exiguobacterium TaxID=2644629 RepID=UPI00103C0B7F|nr:MULTISPECIES: aldo/keto reductase [unclassified Exiguobacterium]TCI26465.1 aldo/keto reductase [Exiguobacterium sp. SH5S4]TCI37664.1 aldo/keto reductase [Exiguobacterium sp. SH4S7]TCI45998.1 aldo/keto reductase [Exiguobacterium sp. SH5S32]TCI51755.1 aldo/keto reductase [Exiguobacterium sp. SH1S4]TCI53607.1 aldo/keto reductase [Exiguobacterium sp. SH5S13]